MDFLTTYVPLIITTSIAVAAYRNNKMAMPLAIFLITYVGFLI